MDFKFLIFILFGILPSMTWLVYYLSKDMHPEPKRMILKVFLLGALITIPVFFVQIGLADLLKRADLGPMTTAIIYWFLIIGLSEELFKYLVIKIKILNSPDLDEPLDIMLYMVVAALGFAALENTLYLLIPIDQVSFNALLAMTVKISFLRFIGATLLHTLCSAIIGYALAISFCDDKNRTTEAVAGIIIAILLHGLYDFSIMMLDGYASIVTPITILLILSLFVFLGFEKLKKIKGVCKISVIGKKIKTPETIFAPGKN